MKYTSVFIAFFLILFILTAFLLYFGLWGYIAWQWIAPDSFLRFLLFMVVWTGLSGLATMILKRILKALRPHIPLVDRLFQKMEQRKTYKTTPAVQNAVDTVEDRKPDHDYFYPYAKPATLQNLQKSDFNFRFLPIYWTDDTYYTVTPVDAITFCRTGGDGCHFAFLTDFGAQNDLENAPIVFVSPMDWDDYVKLVARNLRDFLGLVCYYGYGEVFRENLENPEKLEALRENVLEHDTFTPERARLYETLYRDFNVPKFDKESASRYLNGIQQQRREKAPIPTLDGLGIPGETTDDFRAFNFEQSETASIEDFLQGATKLERLKFYRDYKFKAGYQMPPETKKLIGGYLEKDGFKREAFVFNDA